MNKNIIKASLVAAMFLTSSAYASSITGSDAATSPTKGTQFGWGGLNMGNITVNLSNGEIFSTADGTYPFDSMADEDTFESSVFAQNDGKSSESTRLGYIYQKPWPLSEPMGLKVINDDADVSINGKPKNCIMASSYLVDFNLGTATPKPVLCSSDAGSNKRFSLALLPNTVVGKNPGDDGNYVDLVFNLADPTDTNTTPTRYQVFQKINNFTGMRLDGFRIQVLDESNATNPALTLSLGEDEKLDHDGLVDPTDPDLWPEYELAFYPPSLWGDGSKAHLDPGWFDLEPSGYKVTGHGKDTIESVTQLTTGNYVDLFGNWQPAKWMPLGMHEFVSEFEEAKLIAYWGTTPTETFNDAPAWHKGQAGNFASPTQQELDTWASNPDKYLLDHIEDIPNLSLNYIVNVGDAISIGSKFIIRITPKISVDQTPPSYISKEDNVTYIMPPALIPPVVDPVDPVEPAPSSGGGGGCTYNPNSKNFDMTFLMLMALGLLYPFRRRFIK